MDRREGGAARDTSIADQAAKSIETQHHADRSVPLSLRSTERVSMAGEATRQNAAEQLRQMARVQRNLALERIRDASRMVSLMEQAERALERARHLDALAAEAATLTGAAEEALWNLAVESARNGV